MLQDCLGLLELQLARLLPLLWPPPLLLLPPYTGGADITVIAGM